MKLGKKGKKKLAAGAAGIVCILLFIRTHSKNVNEEITTLERPDYGKDDYIYTLQAQCGDDSYMLSVPVSAKKLADKELQSAFDSAFELICAKMPGDNPSLDEVRSNLVFTASVPEYGMTVDYTLDDYSVINCFGEINNKESVQESENYTVYAQITCGALSQNYEIPVTVLPPVYSDEELKINKIMAELAKADSAGGENDMLLPQSVDGQEIVFVKKPESNAPLALLLLLAVFACWYYKRFVLKKKAEDERAEQMRLDYSEIVSKLSLLMGAGMSGANAFARMSRDYSDAKENQKQPVRYAYEEIMAASNRIAAGISEAEAYAAFGRSCRIHCYIKLASLMAQNVIKGTEGFGIMLRNEVTEAFSERKAHARTKGEEAGTKLLMPMIMMLGVVLVIIIVPAFMSF